MLWYKHSSSGIFWGVRRSPFGLVELESSCLAYLDFWHPWKAGELAFVPLSGGRQTFGGNRE